VGRSSAKARKVRIDGGSDITLGCYIKPQTQDVVAAMEKFEAEIAAYDFGDTNRTLNRTSGAVPDP
jgi:hypothetical protein